MRNTLLGSPKALEGFCTIEGLKFEPCLFDNNLPLLLGLHIFMYLLGLGGVVVVQGSLVIYYSLSQM